MKSYSIAVALISSMYLLGNVAMGANSGKVAWSMAAQPTMQPVMFLRGAT